jgi:PAS domain S-box-containing protein
VLLAHKNEYGEVESFSLIARDITEPKQAEEARALLAAIVESSSVAIVSKTLEGRITSWNAGAQRIFGYSPEEVLGRSITMLIPPDRQDEEQDILRRLSRGERIEHLETVRVAKDGRAINISLTVSPVCDQSGRVIGASKVAQDITERKRAEAELAMYRTRLEELVRERTAELNQSLERLRLADRLASIGTLAAGLGHDMGNLLLPVRMRLESLEQHKLVRSARDDIDAIKTAMEYLRRLCQGLRLFSLDPDTVRKEGDRTHLHRWWEEVEPFLRNALPRTIVLKSSLPATLPPAAMAPHVFTQVVYNLVQNAGDVMKAQPTGSVQIQAEVINEGRAIVISVADDGPGMTDEVKRRCMEPFFTTKPRGISTGFGLALVRGAVLKAGGAVEVYSQPGRGTEIRLVLPTVPDDAHELVTPVDRTRLAHLSLSDGQMRAYVASVLRSLKFEITHGPWSPQIEAELLVLDGDNGAREELEAFLSRDPNRHAVVFGGEQIIGATNQLTVVEAKPPPARIRETLRIAARKQPLQHATL